MGTCMLTSINSGNRQESRDPGSRHVLCVFRHRKCIHPIHPPSKVVTVEVSHMCMGTHSDKPWLLGGGGCSGATLSSCGGA